MWAMLISLCSPDWFGIERLNQLTGISQVSLRGAMERLRDAGFLEIRQRPDDRRHLRYRPIFDDPNVLCEYMQVHWRAWRDGGGTPALKPVHTYFTTEEPWRLLGKRLAQRAISAWPTGVTYLEGGPMALDTPTLAAAGGSPRIDLYCLQNNLELLHNLLNCTPLPVQHEDMTGRICALDENHPIALLALHRLQLSYATPLPWGLAALDAIDDADQRVAQEGRAWLRKWVEHQAIEQRKGMA